MKRNTRYSTIFFVAIIATAMSLPVFAIAEQSPAPPQMEPIPHVYQLEDLPDASNSESTQLADIDTVDEAVAQEAPTPKKQSDIPLFVGAGISVLVFGGVVAFCKMKGNR